MEKTKREPLNLKTEQYELTYAKNRKEQTSKQNPPKLQVPVK